MNYREATALISEATDDIKRAEAAILDAHAADNTANFAAIAQAKLLAVIASALTEMKEVSVNREI